MMEKKRTFSLAPMAGFTDSVFRRIAGECGADFAVSEMISAMALCRRDRKTAELAKIGPREPPTVLQLFGRDPAILGEAAELLLSGDYPGCSYAAAPAGIDLNMGCPVKKIVSNGEGSALMLDPERAARIVSAVKDVCVRHGVPCSVKFRRGWDAASPELAPEFAVRMAEAGADRITLHCRTREQMYAPSADPEAARRTAEALRAAGFSGVFAGNGDIDSPEAAERYFAAGCGEAAVGRAALGNPWLFRQLKDPVGFVPPTADEIREMVIRFVTEEAEEKGEAKGVRESRARAAYFIRGMRGAAALRDRLNRAETAEEFVSALRAEE